MYSKTFINLFITLQKLIEWPFFFFRLILAVQNEVFLGFILFFIEFYLHCSHFDQFHTVISWVAQCLNPMITS